MKSRIYHVNQKTTEAYVFNRISGWVNVPLSIADDWKPSEYEYHEIRHSNEKNNNGLYGRTIEA